MSYKRPKMGNLDAFALENLLASGSMISLRRYQQNPLQLEDLFLIQLDQCAVLANDL
jgi:hypothetical protein